MYNYICDAVLCMNHVKPVHLIPMQPFLVFYTLWKKLVQYKASFHHLDTKELALNKWMMYEYQL